jgi:hypothetical protein
MNNQKEAIKLARRLYDEGHQDSARHALKVWKLADKCKSVGDSITRLEQEYGILDEVLTESESERYFRDRCKIHEMRDEAYLIKKAKAENRDLTEGEFLFLTGGIDPEHAGIDMDDEDKKTSLIAGLFLIGVLLSALVLVVGFFWMIISLVL